MDCSCGHDHSHDHHHHHHHDHDHAAHGGEPLDAADLPDPEALARELHNWHGKQLEELLASGAPVVAVDKTLDEVLADLGSAMRDFDQRVEGMFLPGLKRDAVLAAWADAPFTLPDDVIRLYGWHNGVDEDAEELFRGFKFLPFSDAVTVWKMLGDAFSDGYLPIMQNLSGCLVLVDLGGGDRGGLVYETDMNHFCHPRVYPSLAAYFGALAACFREGAFVAEDGELVGRHKRMDAVFSRYSLRNPQEDGCRSCADMAAALAPEREEDALFDYRMPL